jgi:hypothetical protein
VVEGVNGRVHSEETVRGLVRPLGRDSLCQYERDLARNESEPAGTLWTNPIHSPFDMPNDRFLRTNHGITFRPLYRLASPI